MLANFENLSFCSLSNYSSGGESVSRHSSLNDSGVFNDDGIGGGEGDKLRVQLPEEGDVINRRPSRISRINIPFVVSIGEYEARV